MQEKVVRAALKKKSQQNKSGIRIRKKEGSNVVMQRPTCKLVFLCICTDRRSLLFGLMLMLMLMPLLLLAQDLLACIGKLLHYDTTPADQANACIVYPSSSSPVDVASYLLEYSNGNFRPPIFFFALPPFVTVLQSAGLHNLSYLPLRNETPGIITFQ